MTEPRHVNQGVFKLPHQPVWVAKWIDEDGLTCTTSYPKQVEVGEGASFSCLICGITQSQHDEKPPLVRPSDEPLL